MGPTGVADQSTSSYDRRNVPAAARRACSNTAPNLAVRAPRPVRQRRVKAALEPAQQLGRVESGRLGVEPAAGGAAAAERAQAVLAVLVDEVRERAEAA